MEVSMEVPLKSKNRTYDSAIPLLGIYPKQCNSTYSYGIYTPMFIAALFTITKI
jgi:hypothetical protein